MSTDGTTLDEEPRARASEPRLGLVLGGGAARGLAHIGVLDVLHSEGIRPAVVAGSSSGGLVAALWAAGLRSHDMYQCARGFRFPRWFVPGAMLEWETIFAPAARVLAPLVFEDLPTPLRVTAVDLERGVPVVLEVGRVLPAVRATCAVPGVLPPERIGGSWLVDGGLVNLLPVDAVWTADVDIVVAVTVTARRAARRIPQLDWRFTHFVSRVGRLLPNPLTAKVSFEVLVRAAEIALARTALLANAMASPELLIEVDVGDIGFRDFDRLPHAVECGRIAAERCLPSLRALLASASWAPAPQAAAGVSIDAVELLDPVCHMSVGPRRARAHATHGSRTYAFCSENCRDAFLRSPERYVEA